VTDQNGEADLVETPEVATLRYLNEDPAKEKSVKGDKYQGMGKVSVIFKIELTVEKAKNEIGVREEPHAQTGNRSPMPNFLVTDRSGNHPSCQGMGNAVHSFILTRKEAQKQIG